MSESVLAMAGAIAGAMEAIAVQPFDMVKTRHQLNNQTNEGVLKTLRSLYQEGGVKRFYRGMTAEVVGIIPKSSGMYGTYEIVRQKLEVTEGYGRSGKSSAIAGFCAGFPEALIVTPTQVVKVRLQAKEHMGLYSGPIDCVFKSYTREGIQVFYRGLGPTLWRNCIWNAVYFGTMYELKALLPKPTSKVADVFQNLASGFFGAMFATCFNAPFDVVKSRFQSQVLVSGAQAKYKYTLPSLATICQEEGIGACYKGFKPKAIRMGLGGAVAMTTFDLVLYFAR